MMNRFIYLFLLLGCAASALVGCTADPEVESLPSTGDGSPSWVTIDFCDNSFDKVNITTRATLDNVAESRVLNLFVFIFNSNGERLYGRFFDHTNRKDTPGQFADAKKEECWIVQDNATSDMPHGKVRIMAPAISGGTLYIIANVNADMVNISPDKLRFVEKLSDLTNMTATLNQEITERNGFFPMTGSASSISVSSGKITIPKSEANPNGKIMLTRLDAKIQVKLRVAKGYMGFTTSTTTTTGETGSSESGSGTGTTEGGSTGTTEGGSTGTTEGGSTGTTEEKIITTHIIESFVPLSWQVVNMPRTAFVMPDPNGADAKTTMFRTKETKFETRNAETFAYMQEKVNDKTHEYEKDESGKIKRERKEVTADVHGFSFYMLENRAAAKATIPESQVLNEGKGYHARETRLKDENGAYTADPDETSDIWKYAPAEGTYLVIKGEVVMALDISNEGKNQQLSADVVYYIHLGNFGGKDTDNDGAVDEYGNINNYDIERNTSYTYTVTIYGVDNIQVEVEKETQENESGATGHVYVAKEQIFTFDSHYGRAVVPFDEGHITDIENLSWYVSTPFGREGKPHNIGGVEVPAGLDYQWVHFMINKHDDNGYSHKHEKYDPEKVMNILDFSKYIKEQKIKFQKDKKDGHIDNDSDFRPEFDQDWYDKFNKQTDDESVWNRYRIYVTIFVDEFYYDANPITGDVRQDLWKDFVNQPNRLMHILCDSDESADEASRTTGSVLTIRQRSIQTVFNTEKPELKTAWGCESIDETRDVLWYFNRKESYDTSGNLSVPPGATDDSWVGNDSDGNGLYNTARIWGLVNGWGEWATYTPKLWSDYVDYDRLYALYDADNKETLRYSCMTRNRDENGNGNIDAMEVKWYTAAISQLASLYIGDQGLSSEAVLYPYYKQVNDTASMNVNNVYPWRLHIVSSTAPGGGGYPEIMWAEEGLSTGHYNQTWGKSATMSVRCVRNLGMDPSSEEEAQKRLANKELTPEQAIQVSGPGIGNNNKITPDSVYKFDMSNLNPLSIRYYSSQELEPTDEYAVESRVYWAFETGPITEETYTYDALFDLLRSGKSPCPEGYRVPNVREGALMSVRIPGGDSGYDWQYVLQYDDNNHEYKAALPACISTYYSHGLRGTDKDTGTNQGKSNSWLFDNNKTYLNTYTHRANIRCVKDIRQ